MSKAQKFSFNEVIRAARQERVSIHYHPFLADGFAMVHQQPFVDEFVRMGVPYLMEDFRFGIIDRGKAWMSTNLVERELAAGDIFALNYGSVIQMNRCTSDFRITGMMISPERLSTVLGERSPLALLSSQGVVKVDPSAEDSHTACQLLDMVWQLANECGGEPMVVRSAVRTFLEYADMLARRRVQSQSPRHSRTLLSRFVELVNHHCADHHATAFYADKLFVTPHYLTVTIKKQSGLTAKEWIDKALVTQAKVMLKGSDMQMAQIAQRLNFPSSSFFSRFFKRHTGMAPQEYRKA